ncbi:MAG: polysaccharide deacetylase family protein, partial [Chitinophagaceae bacterium]
MKISQQALFKPFRKMANMGGGQAVILLYHRVIDLKPDPQELCVSPHHFREQITFLKEKYNILSSNEFADHLLKGKKFPPKSVLLTFDDGYADNFQLALPILEELQAQAIFYITTSKLNTNEELWWDDLERVFLDRRNKPSALTLHVEGEKHRYDVSAESVLWKLYGHFQKELRFYSPDKIDNILDQLRRWSATSKSGRTSHRMMSLDELKIMSGSSSAII